MTSQGYRLAPSTSPSRRFWTKVRLGPGCWEWDSHRNAHGYGVFSLKSELILAHRFVVEAMLGRSLAGDERALHRCDNPACVRPDHLFVGTQADNTADKLAKGRGRGAVGERNAKAKLTEVDVLAIRQKIVDGHTNAAIAREYGVTATAISDIKLGKKWQHVGQVELRAALGEAA